MLAAADGSDRFKDSPPTFLVSKKGQFTQIKLKQTQIKNIVWKHEEWAAEEKGFSLEYFTSCMDQSLYWTDSQTFS